jgi:murein DD-endopeptidase MepM/ murein hydrolase activator NlpD
MGKHPTASLKFKVPKERYLVRWGRTGRSHELRLGASWRRWIAFLVLVFLGLFGALAWVTWTLAHGYPLAWYEERRQIRLEASLQEQEASAKTLRPRVELVDSMAVREAARYGLVWNSGVVADDISQRSLLERLFPEQTASRELAQEMQDLSNRLETRSGLLLQARDAEMKFVANWEKIPSIYPMQGHFSSPFGYRVNPVTGVYQLHAGMDFDNHIGTPIHATGGGTVIEQEFSSTYGNYVLLRHASGMATRYAHMSAVKVSQGQVLKRGDLIGLMGSTGRSTGPHLHYEVLDHGTPVNPLGWILPMRIDP